MEDSPHVSKQKAARTGFDWLRLLLPSLILIAGFTWLSIEQYQLNLQANRQQHDTALQVAADQQQQAILSNYEARITDMMLHDGLRESKSPSTQQLVARTETGSTLRQLNSNGKGALLRFLYETKLISNDTPIINLRELDAHNANLHNLDLRDTNLSGLDLHGADARGSNLSYAELQYANLSNADLSGADLHGCDLRQANLAGANLSGANLKDVTNLTQQQLAQ
ncbi:MAG: pentapeptide repeat-containing protein [Ktedonobacteraceae bacterium]|nr:pentapeptide repeat-containing protein [Ktedonobacteraceae bacterium]